MPKARRAGERPAQSRPKETTSKAIVIISVNISGKKCSELYLLRRGTPSSPGTAWTSSSRPGMLGRLFAMPSTTRTKASPRARRPVQWSVAPNCASGIRDSDTGTVAVSCMTPDRLFPAPARRQPV